MSKLVRNVTVLRRWMYIQPSTYPASVGLLLSGKICLWLDNWHHLWRN